LMVDEERVEIAGVLPQQGLRNATTRSSRHTEAREGYHDTALGESSSFLRTVGGADRRVDEQARVVDAARCSNKISTDVPTGLR